MRALAVVWGALLEAWQELRIHRTRVLLSLIGVGVAVCALSSVVAAGNIAQQSIVENNDRWGGRPALVSMAPSDASVSADRVAAAWQTVVERHAVRYSSAVQNAGMRVQFRDGASQASAILVDPDYATMHRIVVQEGRWLADSDEARLAPTLVVNEAFWNRLGVRSVDEHPTVTVIRGDRRITALVVGMVRIPSDGDSPNAYVLRASGGALVDTNAFDYGPTRFEAWVPPELGDPLVAAMTSELRQLLGEDIVSVSRSDYLATQQQDPLVVMKLLVIGIAMLILLLGALGLLNIAMVTVRGRIREIGVRRSFGATGARVFVAVMLESVVATVVAGAAGVALSILIVKSPWLEELIGRGMVTEPPPFPVEAAVFGLVSATVVGALAGLLPALVAVRVKVIDAIRY